MEEPDVEQLPKTVIRRVVKEKLSDLSGGNDDSQMLLHKDALLAFSEASRVFIHYLSATYACLRYTYFPFLSNHFTYKSTCLIDCLYIEWIAVQMIYVKSLEDRL